MYLPKKGCDDGLRPIQVGNISSKWVEKPMSGELDKYKF